MATTGYLRRSWNALTSDEDWWKSVCILSLISLIPIIGPIAVSGYCFRWAREAAWGIEEPLPRGKGDLGAAIKSGWFVFLPTFVWAMVISIAFTLLCLIPYVGGFLGVILLLASIVAMIVVYVMVLRGVIYDKMGPGFQIGQAWKMCREEPEGLVRVFGVGIVCSTVTLFFAMIVYILVFCLVALLSIQPYASSSAAAHYTYGNGYNGYGISTMDLSTAIPSCIFAVIVFGLIALFVQTTATALVTRSLGYWMAQFEPARWGSSSAGVPQGVGPQGIAERARRKYERAQQAAQAAQQQYEMQQQLQAQQLQAQQQQPMQQVPGQEMQAGGPTAQMPADGAMTAAPPVSTPVQAPEEGMTASMRPADVTAPMSPDELTVQVADAEGGQQPDEEPDQGTDDPDDDSPQQMS